MPEAGKHPSSPFPSKPRSTSPAPISLPTTVPALPAGGESSRPTPALAQPGFTGSMLSWGQQQQWQAGVPSLLGPTGVPHQPGSMYRKGDPTCCCCCLLLSPTGVNQEQLWSSLHPQGSWGQQRQWVRSYGAEHSFCNTFTVSWAHPGLQVCTLRTSPRTGGVAGDLCPSQPAPRNARSFCEC